MGEAEAPPQPTPNPLSPLPLPLLILPAAKRDTEVCNRAAKLHFISLHLAVLNVHKRYTAYLLYCTYTTGYRTGWKEKNRG